VQIYAYGGKYKDVSLDDVGCALIGTQKIHLEKAFGDLDYSELAHTASAILKSLTN
jgi:hypothetical protein